MMRFHTGVLSARRRRPSTLFAEGVLISSVAPSLDLSPRSGGKEAVHFARRKHPGAARFAVTVFETGQPGKQPHREKRNRCPECPARLGPKTTAARPENAIHFSDSSTA